MRVRVYGLSGSHGIGKTTTFNYLKQILSPKKFAFVGEFADSILKQIGIRNDWREKILPNRPAYSYFEDALDACTIASYLVHKDKVIIADRSIVDTCAYRLLAGLPPNAISLFNLRGVDLCTFFMRSKAREDSKVVEAIKEVLTRFDLPFEEVPIIEGKPKETAELIADRIRTYHPPKTFPNLRKLGT